MLSLDEGVRDLVDTLKKSRQLDNTLIVFTSDQGIAMGHHGMEIKVAPYDDNIRVPLIVRLPNEASAGTTIDGPVNTIDLIPTFFDYAGIDLPWEMHGSNLRPVFENPSQEWDRGILQENFSRSFGSQTDVGLTIVDPDKGLPNQNVNWWLFYRYGEYKYVTTLVPNEIEELYNIEQDPRELDNLALNPECFGQLEELRAMMIRELRRTEAGLAENLPQPHRPHTR